MDTIIGQIDGIDGRQSAGPDTVAIRVIIWGRNDSERGTTRRFLSMAEAADFVSAIAEVVPDANITITAENILTIYARED